MTHALAMQLQSLAEDLQLAGVEGDGGIDGKMCLYVYVIVAPPMIVSVWSMAVVLFSSQNMALSDVSHCVHGQ